MLSIVNVRTSLPLPPLRDLRISSTMATIIITAIVRMNSVKVNNLF